MSPPPSPTTSPLLEGYSIVEWPDLTCDRYPAPKVHTASAHLDSFTLQSHGSLLLAVIARIIGAYCATTDTLLAVQPPSKPGPTFVRVAWSDTDSWQDIAAGVSAQPGRSEKYGLSLGDIRRAFDLPDKQNPCPALVQFTRSEEANNFPATFTFDSSTSTLSLSAPHTLLHPSINDQILAQVTFLLKHAAANLKATMASNPPFPPNLMSIYARLPDEEISRAYPHMPLVSFATEYLGRRAKSDPDAIAVKWFPELLIDEPELPSESVTYAELDRRASQAARWLVSQGLRQEDRVAVCLNRDITFHAVFIGIMRAGGCYVPIDPELPFERKAYIARDSGARFVLTTSDLSSPDLFGSPSIYLDEARIQSEIQQQSGDEFNIASPEGLGYMLYTSGTTGNPKGCLLTSHGLAQAILALSSTAADVRMKDLSQGRYLAVASIAFDVHLAETLVPMALGMPLLSAPRSQLLENLPQYVKVLGITHLGIVPSLIEATLNASKDEDGSLALRYIASGGEKMSDSILDKWANHPQVRLANFYGPSEVTIGCCARYMSSNTPRANIGKPLANVSGYVVDADLNILPRGGVGELVVEGPLVGRGYHGRPDLTQKVFLEWPSKGCRAYRTGDLVRMMPDSTIEILGRIDTQIKVRGVRIESEGISAIVRKAAVPSPEMVLDATTVLAKHPSLGNEQLVSFVTWDPSVSVFTRRSQKPALVTPPQGLIKSIRTICRAELASYMRPNHVIPLNWLPFSSNGKIDTKILVEIFKQLDIADLAALISEDRNAVVRACTPHELQVFNVMKRHAPSYTQRPHPELNVFECGLDSMAVIRFTSDLKSTFGKSISATDIMKKPCLEDISRLIDSATTEAASLAPAFDVAIDVETQVFLHSVYGANAIEDILPPFPVQEGVLARSAEDTGLYVQHVTLRLEAGVSLAQLQESWNSIIQTHPILRTVFQVDRSAWQVVLKSNPLHSIWSGHKLDLSTVDEFNARFSSILASEITKEINENIASIPPLRINTFTCNGLNIFVLSIHHALYDGTALPNLLKDVEMHYLGTQRLPTASLPAILSHIAKQDVAAARQFWVDTFKNFAWSQPVFQNVDSPTQYSSAVFDLKLSQIKEFANKKRVTLQAFLSFIFAYLAGTRLYHSNDVSFGVIRSGRMLPVENIDYAICPTITVLPTRVNLGEANSTLANLQGTISAMTEYEHVSLGKVQSWLRPGEPLFEVLFSMSVHQPDESNIWHHCNYEPPTADYPLSVEAVLDVHADLLTVRAAWKTAEVADDLVEGMLSQFEKIAVALDRNETLSLPTSIRIGQKDTHEPETHSTVAVDPTVVATLRSTICDFLQIPTPILTDGASFLSLGLDSIKAVGLARRIRKLGYAVSSAEIVKASTLDRLSRTISATSSKVQGPSSAYVQRLHELRARVPQAEVQLSAQDEVQVFPTTALQSGMLSQTIGSDGRLYIHAFPLSLSSGVDAGRLMASWEKASNLIATLRTSFFFISETGQWAQVVHSAAPLRWTTEALESSDATQAIHAFLGEIECADELAFASPPVWLRLFTAPGGAPSALAVVMHHALYDGISVQRLFPIVEAIYHGEEVAYRRQFTDLLPDFFRQEQEGTQFWEKQLAGFVPPPFPILPQSAPLPPNKIIRQITLPSQDLSNLVKASEATLQCLLQAALATSLGSLTESKDVVFGLVISGRRSEDSEDVVGPILNTIPCRVTIKEDLTITQLLQTIHRFNLNTSLWHQSSLRSIQKALKVDKLLDCLFTFQPLATQPTDAPPSIWKLYPVDNEEVQIQYPLHVEVEHTPSGFSLRCACRGNALDQSALEKFAATMAHAVESFVRRPGDLVSTVKYSPLSQPDQPLAKTPNIVASSSTSTSSILTIQPSLLVAIRSFAPDAEVSLDTPLPALGIDSITAIQISGKCRRDGLRLTATQILNSSTVKDLVLAAVDLNAPKSAPSQLPEVFKPFSTEEKDSIIRRFGEDGKHIEHISRCSAGMQWHIGGWQRSHAAIFQHVFTFKLPDDINIARFKNSWYMLIRRHELLRSTFATSPGGTEPRLVTFSKDYDFDHWADEVVDDAVFYRALLDRMKDTVSNPLPISRPPIHGRVFRSSKKTFFILHIHHFQYDAWSMQVLLNDLSATYNVRETPAVGDLRAYTALFDHNERRFDIQRKFWQSKLSTNFKPSLFPSLVGSKRPEGRLQSVIEPSAVLGLSNLELQARDLGLNLQNVFLAVWAQVQAKFSGQAEATFGIWQVGRSGHVDGIERLAVPCVTVLPMHVKVVGSALDISRAIKEDLAARTSEPLIEHSTLVNIAKWTGLPANSSPMFNVNVNVVKVPTTLVKEGLFEPVRAPHFIPKVSVPTVTPTLDQLAVTGTVNQDVTVDIVLDEKRNAVLVSLEVFDTVMSEVQAGEIIREWATIVRRTLLN